MNNLQGMELDGKNEKINISEFPFNPPILKTIANKKALADALEWHLQHHVGSMSVDFIWCIKRSICELRK